ncbi:MAG: YCF48-related protein [Patescibacteria group bacterium]|nr:YCF48-related protein [Patescibacteria group bacterium]
MKKISLLKFAFLAVAAALTLSGCSLSFNTGAGKNSAATDGGIYKSSNKGANWQQKASILTVGSKKSMAAVDTVALASDPQDNLAIYAGSVANGLFFTYNGGEGWQQAANSGQVTVTNIAVDPANKCVIYATGTNKVYKSMDCSRTFGVIYFDNDLKVSVTALAIDYTNSSNVFIGTSRGEIIMSSDQGATWRTLNRFKNQVDKIVFNPVNVKNIFVGTANGVFRSIDSGLTWKSLEEVLKAYNSNRPFRDLIMIKADKPTLFLATSYGLLKSTDNGSSWSKIELITPVSGATINSIAANPVDANEIYYVTNTTFYRSLDGGKNWLSKQLPTTRAGRKLLVDQKNPSVIYLAVRQISK